VDAGPGNGAGSRGGGVTAWLSCRRTRGGQHRDRDEPPGRATTRPRQTAARGSTRILIATYLAGDRSEPGASSWRRAPTWPEEVFQRCSARRGAGAGRRRAPWFAHGCWLTKSGGRLEAHAHGGRQRGSGIGAASARPRICEAHLHRVPQRSESRQQVPRRANRFVGEPGRLSLPGCARGSRAMTRSAVSRTSRNSRQDFGDGDE